MNYPQIKNESSVRWEPDIWFKDSKLFAHTVPVKLQIQYAGIHNFKDNSDYYIVKQNLIAQNSKLNCPSDARGWILEYVTSWFGRSQHAYYAGPYMKSIAAHIGISRAELKDPVKIEFMYGMCFPKNEYKATPVNESFEFGLNPSDKGFAIGLGGTDFSASFKDGIKFKYNQSETLGNLQVTKKTTETEWGQIIMWDYVGPGIEGTIRGHKHDVVPLLQRSDCDLEQAYVVKIDNPENKRIKLHNNIKYVTEMLHGCFYGARYNDLWTQQKGDQRQCFWLDPIARYTHTWKMYLNLEDRSKLADFEKLLSSYFKKYAQTTTESFDIFNAKQLSDSSNWNKSWHGKYFKNFEESLKNSFKLFNSAYGPGEGTYRIGFVNDDSEHPLEINYIIEAPKPAKDREEMAKQKVKVDVEYIGFDFGKTKK